MQCPNCNETLVMADRQGVEIDYCPKCRGVWLDRGELDKIVERSADYAPRQDYEGSRDGNYGKPQYDDDYYKKHPQQGGHHNQGYPHKKKKGFLGDFFDFD